MRTAAALKLEIEAKLANRIPGALSPLVEPVARLQPTGVAALDALLEGGLPLGSLCELTGPACSGRTSLALALLAKASAKGACAYVDVGDSLHPHSAAAAGVRLENLLWIRFAEGERGGGENTAPVAAESRPDSLSPAVPVQAGVTGRGPWHAGMGGHPRTETRGLAPALETMLAGRTERQERRREGTPGWPNQPFGLEARLGITGLGTASAEQVAWERFNKRKPDEGDPLRQANQRSAQAAREGRLGGPRPVHPVRGMHAEAALASGKSAPVTPWPGPATEPLSRDVQRDDAPARKPTARVWRKLDAALRATDQVLQAGGFRVLVLDLASLEPEEALRVPSATWWRYRRAVQGSDALLILLTQAACARSSAACVLQCTAPLHGVKGQFVLTGVPFQTEVARQRTGTVPGRKSPGRAAGWGAAPPWMRAVGL